MNESIDAELMRFLTGELGPEKAAALEQRLERDGDLARRYGELEAGWRGLVLPPASPIPLGLETRIVAQAKEIEKKRHELEWGRAPAWARAVAAFALAAGIVLGVGISDFDPVAASVQTVESLETESTDSWTMDQPGLAELYADAVEQSAWQQEEENGS